jgi:hypothetical protein
MARVIHIAPLPESAPRVRRRGGGDRSRGAGVRKPSCSPGACAGHDHTSIIHAARHGRRDLRRPLVEQVHEFGERASDLVAPQHRPAIGLSEREANADLIPDLSDLPLQDVRNPERIADFDRIQVGTANEESCAARTDEEAAKSRQVEDEFVRQTLGKKTLVLTAVESCQRLLEALTCSCSSGCERPRTTFDHLASRCVLLVPILSGRKRIMPVSGEQRKPTRCASRWHPVQNSPAADGMMHQFSEPKAFVSILALGLAQADPP